MKYKGYKVVGTFSDVGALRKIEPDLSIYEVEHVLAGREFARWYVKNRKAVNALAFAVPAVTMAILNIPAIDMFHLAGASATPAFEMFTDPNNTGVIHPQIGSAVTTAAAGGGYSFWAGNGAILLHFLVVGFVTLIITTFLKFTGRGDLAPLVMFVAGGIILYEVLGLFKAIYSAVATFFAM